MIAKSFGWLRGIQALPVTANGDSARRIMVLPVLGGEKQ